MGCRVEIVEQPRIDLHQGIQQQEMAQVPTLEDRHAELHRMPEAQDEPVVERKPGQPLGGLEVVPVRLVEIPDQFARPALSFIGGQEVHGLAAHPGGDQHIVRPARVLFAVDEYVDRRHASAIVPVFVAWKDRARFAAEVGIVFRAQGLDVITHVPTPPSFLVGPGFATARSRFWPASIPGCLSAKAAAWGQLFFGGRQAIHLALRPILFLFLKRQAPA